MSYSSPYISRVISSPFYLDGETRKEKRRKKVDRKRGKKKEDKRRIEEGRRKNMKPMVF